MSEIIGKALAGHAARGGDKDNPKLAQKASQYDNPLTDWICLLIAEKKAHLSLQQQKSAQRNASIDNI